MRNLKKFLALVLAMMMVFSMMVTVNAASSSDSTAAVKTAVTKLQDYGVLQGYPDGQIHEDYDITRAHMAAIVYRIMTGDTEDDQESAIENYGIYAEKFTDIGTAAWAKGYIGFCANHDILVGYPDGKVQPNKHISGYEVLAMLLRALGYGRNGEYQGTKWQDEVLYDATRHSIYGGAVNVSQDPGQEAPRGTVAIMTYNAVSKTYMVDYYANSGLYNPTTEKLITDVTGSAVTKDDIWGAPLTTTPRTVTFNWPDEKVTKDLSTEVDPVLKTYYGPVTECDVYEDTGVDGPVATYTNGAGNEGTRELDRLNTTVYLGAEGRETRVYKDRIVYRDTVLSVVQSSKNAVYDTAGHKKSDAETTVRVFGNDVMEGLDGARWATLPINSGAPAKNAVSATLSGVAYPKGTVLTSFVLTKTNSNDLDTGTGTVTLKEASVANPVNVTVDGIIYSKYGNVNGSAQTPAGIRVGSTDYLYNVAYGYNMLTAATGGATVAAPNTGSSILALDNTAINKSYDLYLGKNNTILGIIPAAADANVGVVTAIRTETVNKESGAEMKVIYLTILKPDETTTEIKYIGTDTDVASANDSTTLPGGVGVRTLVKYEPNASANGYSNVYLAATGSLGANVAFEIGDADVISGTNSNAGLVDDKTVFFVANYTMSNSLDNGQGAYTPNGYTVYKGFQNLPKDLKMGTNTAIINSEGEELKAAGYNKIDWYAFDTGLGTSFSADEHLSYVLILNGTDRSNNVEEDVPDYAYVQYNLQQNVTFDGYYLYNVYRDGVKGTMRLDSAAHNVLVANGNGLFTYREATNETEATVTYVNKTYGNWEFHDGVLELQYPRTDGDANEYQGLNGKTTAGFKSGVNLRYMTVTPEATIYIVNEQTGEVYLFNGDLEGIKDTYGNPTMYFQLNQYGWIDFLYVVDNTPTTPSTGTPDDGSDDDDTDTEPDNANKLLWRDRDATELEIKAEADDDGNVTVTINATGILGNLKVNDLLTPPDETHNGPGSDGMYFIGIQLPGLDMSSATDAKIRQIAPTSGIASPLNIGEMDEDDGNYYEWFWIFKGTKDNGDYVKWEPRVEKGEAVFEVTWTDGGEPQSITVTLVFE